MLWGIMQIWGKIGYIEVIALWEFKLEKGVEAELTVARKGKFEYLHYRFFYSTDRKE